MLLVFLIFLDCSQASHAVLAVNTKKYFPSCLAYDDCLPHFALQECMCVRLLYYHTNGRDALLVAPFLNCYLLYFLASSFHTFL